MRKIAKDFDETYGIDINVNERDEDILVKSCQLAGNSIENIIKFCTDELATPLSGDEKDSLVPRGHP